MQTLGTPPKLTAIAERQIRALATDSALAFQQLRSIGRSTQANNAQLTRDRDEKRNREMRLEEISPYPDRRLQEEARHLAERIRELQSRIHTAESRLVSLEQSAEAIRSWHTPVARVLESVLKELGGFSSVEDVLPDFDDGISAELSAMRDAAAQAQANREIPARRIGR